jgi:penicillin amidase
MWHQIAGVWGGLKVKKWRIAVFVVGVMALAAQEAIGEFSSTVRVINSKLPGLEKPGEIVVDVWGIPHIYASSEHDLFLLQGYNAARDRLWQIDLWRKRGLGLLARDLGSSFVAQDRAARMFLYRGDMAAEWTAYGPKAKDYVEAFVAGVNEYVRQVRGGDRPLPVEFKIAGTVPDFWRPEDVVRIRSHGLTRNVTSEVRRALIACVGGLQADQLRVRIEPKWNVAIPVGFDACTVPKDVLADYDLATRAVTFVPLGRRAELHDSESFLAKADQTAISIGSNNWVIAGSRTATGRPILANDPHRTHSVPSLRYIVHLNSPDKSIVGAGEPALPGISIGHNDKIAFGLTAFGADQEDLYVYELNPNNSHEYKYGGAWEVMTIVRELVEVRGEPAREIEMRFTRHGPVLKIDESEHRAFALRSVWFEPGTSAYLASTDFMTASSWSEFQNSLERWGTPSENHVYADTAGNIGWLAAGKVPIRPNWDGLLPVPGDGRYEWSGFWSLNDLPSRLNPDQGWLATANEMNLPRGYPIATRKIGFDRWADSARFERISEVLSENRKFTLADVIALQNDETSIHARRLIALLKTLTSQDPLTARALELLKEWDASDRADSAAAALFEVWIAKHLRNAVVAIVTPAPARPLMTEVDIGAVISLFERADAALGSDPAGTRDRILIETLKSAIVELNERLGERTENWAWGKLHRATFVHALAALTDEPTKSQLTVGPLSIGGASNVLRSATYEPKDFSVVSGASFRMVLDVGDWDKSRVINAPGQSGNPNSAHYRDLAPLWAAGDYVPLLYSRAAVENAAEVRLLLSP